MALIPPEQCRGEGAAPASDLYALGCMMFQLLTGQLPFIGSPAQVIHARLSRAAPRVQRRVSGIPEELAEICHRLLARDPAERPSLRAVREVLLNGVLPGATSGIRHETAAEAAAERRTEDRERTPSFIGRAQEKEELLGCLRRAAEGSLQWVLLSGESGIGKSALAAVLMAEAERQGFLCVSGRCYEREQVPFVAFDRAVDALIGKLAAWPPERRAPLAGSLEMLRPVFPAVSVLSDKKRDGLTVPEVVDPRDQYRRAAAGLCRLLDSCQAQAPLLWILDDLQWADEESIELLAALLSRCSGRVLFLLLSRPEGLEAERPLHRLLPLSPRVISLAGLTLAELAQLAEGVAGEGVDSAAAQALLARSEGNPFLALQLLGHLCVPVLSDRAEHLLAIAATAGGDSSRRLLAAASGLPVADFDLALAELLSARLLKALPTPTTGGTLERLDLYHDRIRETTYEGLLPDRRRTLHRTLAQTLEAQPPAGGPSFEELLRHWTGAGDRDKRRHFTARAAEQAAEKLAFRRAAQLSRSLLDEPDPHEAPLITAARWERVGELWEYSGQLTEACEAYQRALARWEHAPVEDERRPVALLRLRGRVAESLMADRKIAEGRAVYASGLAGMGLRLERPPSVQLAVSLGLQLKLALTGLLKIGPWARPRDATAFERAQLRFLAEMVRAMTPLWFLPSLEAMARCELLARRLVDRRLLHQITVSKVFGAALLRKMGPAKLARLHKTLDTAQELAAAHHIPCGHETVQLTRSLLFFWAADHTRARRENEEAQAGLAKQGLADGYDSAVARAIYMNILFQKGDYERLLELIEREQAGSHPNFYNVVHALAFKARILAQRGRCSEAEAALVRTQELLAPVPPCNLMIFPALASIAVQNARGDYEQALLAGQRTEALLREVGGPISGFIRGYLHEGFLDAALGLEQEGKLTRTARARARSMARSLAKDGVLDFPCMGSRAAALLAHHEGRSLEAQRSLAQALSRSRTGTHPYRRWLCLLAAQELRAASPDLVREAAALAEEHGFVRRDGAS